MQIPQAKLDLSKDIFTNIISKFNTESDEVGVTKFNLAETAITLNKPLLEVIEGGKILSDKGLIEFFDELNIIFYLTDKGLKLSNDTVYLLTTFNENFNIII